MSKGWMRAVLVFVISLMAISAIAETPSWKLSIPVADLEKLISADANLVRKSVANGVDDKKAQSKAKVLAVMIAGYAQIAMEADKSKADQFAAVRDCAVRLSEAIEAGKGPESKALAAELTTTNKANGLAHTGPIDLAQHMELEDLMDQFKPELGTGGGRGLEKKLKSMIGKRSSLLVDEFKEAVQLGYQSAVIAQFTEALGPSADEGKKKKADWAKWSRDMGERGTALGNAASAAKPDDRAVKAALRKLDETCVKCHAVFRD